MPGECLEKFLVVTLGRCHWPLVEGSPGTLLYRLLYRTHPPPAPKSVCQAGLEKLP